ncbi:23S rRNA (guanine745-N1)-methyltransferase [Friedmanniella endophytica]|uniref:23S rRNA (Guanine745-N1)-methyltransferase n=1 Tax=Microlunatus kandeliicorticis TaxID=1759536 RepID=A0A7W3IS41_9ACTN|nr:hypothetical protein [Microlunatus kandeliicorticis]MBA8794231.1 23S rRNA (guanine745-N1)-methyltransferase [Microlunatus kandeliicorticis]
MSLAAVADLLACPHCAAPLTLAGRRLTCPRRHSYDLARQGYVNLLAGPTGLRADTAEMVAARDRFLRSGRYAGFADRLADRVAALIGDGTPDAPAVLESGAGTGHYLAAVLDRLSATAPAARGLALDLSVPACRRAARAHPRIGAAVAETWSGLPVRDGACAVVLSVFAPRNPAAFARVLAPGGVAVVLGAGPDHLAEVRERLGLLGIEPDKADRLRTSMEPWFDTGGEEEVTFRLALDRNALADLVAMGPNAFHGEADRVGEGADVTASGRIAWFRRR